MKELKQEYWSRVKKGRHVSVGRKDGKCFQWKANGQCSRGDSWSFNHGSHSGQRAESSSSTFKAPTQTDGRKPYGFRAPRGVSPSGLKGPKPCKHFLGGKCTEPSWDLWHPPRVPELQAWIQMQVWWQVPFQTHWGWCAAQQKVKAKWRKGSVALLKEACQLGCVSQDSPQKKAIPWEDGKLGLNHTVKFSKTTMRHAKFSGKRRVHRRESSQNANLRSECRGLQNSRKERKMKPSGKSDATAEQPGTWPRMFFSLKKESQDAFYPPAEARIMPAPSSTKPEERQYVK